MSTLTRLPDNFPALLRAAGLTVVEVGDWQDNARPGPFGPVGVNNHHTGSFDAIGDTSDDLSYARWLFRTGRPDLTAPLCQITISAEGVVYVGAAGRANHAGTAKAAGSVAAGDGNTLYVGIEWMLSGTQPISSKQYGAGATTNAVLLRLMGSSIQTVQCHYATSVTGKWDIGDPDGVPFNGHMVLDLPKFRRAVDAEMVRLASAKPKPKPKPTKVTEARDRLIIALRRAELDGKTKRAKALRAGLKVLPAR
jgi:hypothetical protein